MPATTSKPATPIPIAPNASPPTATSIMKVLQAARGVGVMLGGPLVLLVVVSGATVRTFRAARAGRLPRADAVAILAGAAAYARWVRPWLRRWGATDAECSVRLPGDPTGAKAVAQSTRAVQIDAPADAVWPWLAQIGQDRGGFYSYAWLENLAGCRMRNADRVHPEWGQRAVGETVLLHPNGGLKILHIELDRALVLEGGWSLVVEPHGPERCRLLTRFYAPAGIAGNAYYAMLLELPHFVMERKMLLEIKRRAESRPA